MKAAVVLLYAALRSLRHFFPAMRSTQSYYYITAASTSLPLSLPLKFSQVEIWQEQIWQRLLLDGEIS